MFVLCVSVDMNNSQAEYTVFHFPQSRLILTAQEDKIIKWCWDVGMFTRHTHTLMHFQTWSMSKFQGSLNQKSTILIRSSVFGGLIVMRLYCIFGIVNSAVCCDISHQRHDIIFLLRYFLFSWNGFCPVFHSLMLLQGHCETWRKKSTILSKIHHYI